MSEEKKRGWVNILFFNILGINSILILGKYIATMVGCSIIIERMVEFYINLPLEIKLNNVFNLAYMFAIMSVPLAMSVYYLEKMVGECKDE